MQRKGPMRDVGKERLWRDIFRKYRDSGLNIRDFCSRNGLTEPSFYAWRREIHRRDQSSSIAELAVESRNPSSLVTERALNRHDRSLSDLAIKHRSDPSSRTDSVMKRRDSSSSLTDGTNEHCGPTSATTPSPTAKARRPTPSQKVPTGTKKPDPLRPSQKSATAKNYGPAFVPVRVSGDGPFGPFASEQDMIGIECLLPSGTIVRCPPSMEPQAVAALVLAWEQGRC